MSATPLPAARLLILASVLLLVLLPIAAPAAAETMTGRVLPPAAAARVELWPGCASPSTGAGDTPGNRPLATVRPGKDGRFQIEASDGEPLLLRVEAEGYLPSEQWVRSDPRLPPLRLRPAETLELALAGPDGQPLAGVLLQLHPDPSELEAETGRWFTPVQLATTGPDGRALFRRAPGDSPALFVASPRLLATRPLAAGSPQRLTLAPGRPVTLKATDPRGRPAPGARVLLSDGLEIGRTGADGRLELAAPAEDLVLTVTAGAGLEAEVDLGPGTGTTLDVALRPGLEIAGRVVDLASGQPIAGAHLATGCRVVTRSAADGSFHLSVPRPTGSLVVRAAGYLPDHLEEGFGPDASPVAFALRPAAALDVQVVDGAGKPVEGARVSAWIRPIAHVGSDVATTGAAGRVRLQVAAGAQFDVTVEHEGFATAREILRTPATGEPPTAPASPGAPGSEIELRLVLNQGAAAFGRLTTGQGEPLAGGAVSIQPLLEGQWKPSPGSRYREAAAGPDGRFELRHLNPGRYELAAGVPGRVEVRRRVEMPAGAPRVDLGDVPLVPGAALEGRVLDERDRPIEGAAVQISDGGDTAPRVESGAGGAFRLADLEPGRVRFQVSQTGYVTASLDQSLPAAEPLIIRLRAARTLTGRVVGPRGEPVRHAQIQSLLTLTTSDGGTSVSGDRLAGTDREGHFRAGGLRPGPLTLAVEAPGYRVREVRVEILADRDPALLEIALETGAVVAGRVLADGRPVIGAEVWTQAWAGSRPSTFPPRVSTDSEGRFHLAGLATGHHWIGALADDGGRALQELEVQPGTQQLDLHLAMGGLSGRVVDGSGRPVAGAELRLSWPNAKRVGGSALDGSFAFAGLAPGAYRLAAYHLERGAAELPEVQVGDAPVALPDLVLEPATETATVTGRLLGVARHDLGSRAQVVARTIAPGEAAPGDTTRTIHVPEDGSYGLTGLAPGTWVIEAHAGERRPVRREVRLAAGERATVDFAFTGGSTLAGQVTLGGQPAPGLQVRLEPDAGATHTGSDGAFALLDLAPGSYTLQVTVHPGGVWSQALEIEEKDRQIEVAVPAGALAGRVLSPAGPVAGARVTADGREGVGPSAVTGEDGAFRLRLLPGRYHVRVQADGAAGLETEVEIAAGGEVHLDLPLP